MPKKSLQEKVASTPTAGQREVQGLKEQLREAHRLIEQQAERIERMGRPGVKIPAGKAPRRHKGSYLRVVVPDTHGSQCDPRAVAAFLADLEHLQPREIVLLGDHLDCGGFLAEHHTWGYVAETDYTFEDDIRAANDFLDRIQATKSNPTIHYCEGNHERRIVAFGITQSLKMRSDRKFILQKWIEMFAPMSVLNIEKRGIHYYQQGEFYSENAIPATITLGQEMLTHGSFCGRHSAKQHVQEFAANVTFGHTHRAQSYITRTATGKTIVGQSHGCLSRLQPLWQHTSPTGWSHGYGIRLVHPSGEFLPFHVPIVDGRSLLVDLADRLR
jgi:predicted phosphodiesterase